MVEFILNTKWHEGFRVYQFDIKANVIRNIVDSFKTATVL